MGSIGSFSLFVLDTDARTQHINRDCIFLGRWRSLPWRNLFSLTPNKEGVEEKSHYKVGVGKCVEENEGGAN